MKISIFGIGYVGAVTAACLCREGHEVVGVDVHPGKVESLRQGLSPVVEPGLPELLYAAKERGLLSATESTADAVAQSDISLVCVGTPPLPQGGQSVEFVEAACEKIEEALAIAGKKRHHLLVRSTLLPGSTRWIASRFQDFPEVEIIFYPEFLREGSAIEDFTKPPLEVAGTKDGALPSRVLQDFLGKSCQYVEWESAEILKFACNAFHATKVVFANEIGRVSNHLGLDAQKVMDLFCQDTRLNLSSRYLKPGNPYGGSCLPKDVEALKTFANQNGLQLPLLESLSQSNAIQFQHLLQAVKKTGRQSIAILGLSFKDQTDDLRGSPMVQLTRELLSTGHNVTVYDPSMDPARLIGSNERIAAKTLPQLSDLLHDSLDEAIGHDSLVIIAHRCVSEEDLKRTVTKDHAILDLSGWTELQNLPAHYDAFC